MPSLGADMESGKLVEWLVKVGDPVHRGDIVAVVETPKSTVEVECFDTGTVEDLLVEEGEKVPVGTPLARLGDGTASAAPVPEAPEPADARTAPETEAPGQREASPTAPEPVLRELALPEPVPLEPAPVGAGAASPGAPAYPDGARATTRLRVSPLARRVAEEEGVDLSTITGSGLGGVIRADDVRRAGRHTTPSAPVNATVSPVTPIAPVAPVAPSTQPAAAPPTSDMRRSIAALMTRSNREIPHYQLTLTVDLHRSMAWLKERNRELEMSERLVPAALLLAATARAVRAVPELNGHWVDDGFRPATDVDLGLILSLRGGGLLVPAIAGADRLTVEETMARVRELTRRARAGRLRGSDLVQPSITVSNLGDQGVDSVLGVIYPPQVALVGFGAVADRPWAVDGMLGVRPLVTASLAGDHRATDGATGSRLLRTIDRLLQTPEEL
ncbi:pyruvate dehydrogenase complex dihydrolipoamide acetyltransferase [Terrabacter carboxydivorans]|uniref:Dihydrolipoamide acetyltransferase component of pyruvate dehydrogenase complex n=2 Tax=Terrabacter carboxydivorans TaxID=619730 RepID=A0ABP5YLW7_9MICO